MSVHDKKHSDSSASGRSADDEKQKRQAEEEDAARQEAEEAEKEDDELLLSLFETGEQEGHADASLDSVNSDSRGRHKTGNSEDSKNKKKNGTSEEAEHGKPGEPDAHTKPAEVLHEEVSLPKSNGIGSELARDLHARGRVAAVYGVGSALWDVGSAVAGGYLGARLTGGSNSTGALNAGLSAGMHALPGAALKGALMAGTALVPFVASYQEGTAAYHDFKNGNIAGGVMHAGLGATFAAMDTTLVVESIGTLGAGAVPGEAADVAAKVALREAAKKGEQVVAEGGAREVAANGTKFAGEKISQLGAGARNVAEKMKPISNVAGKLAQTAVQTQMALFVGGGIFEVGKFAYDHPDAVKAIANAASKEALGIAGIGKGAGEEDVADIGKSMGLPMMGGTMRAYKSVAGMTPSTPTGEAPKPVAKKVPDNVQLAAAAPRMGATPQPVDM